MINTTRTGAVIRKELTEFRRNRLIIVTATILPAIFLSAHRQHSRDQRLDLERAAVHAGRYSLFLPLLVPLFIPATMSAFSVVGEREQGTLEPVLTTPITRTELIGARRRRSSCPRRLSYLMFGVFLAIVALFANRRSPPRCGTRRSSRPG